MKLNLPARAINFVAPFMADNDIRYYLNGIYVRPMTGDEGCGVLVAACDGHTLGMWRDDDADTVCGRTVILRITPGLLSACRKNTDRRRVTVAGNRLTVVEYPAGATSVVATEVYIQPATDWVAGTSTHQPWELAGGWGNYPDIMQVVPDDLSNERGCEGKMNARYVERVAKAFTVGSGNRKYGVGLSMRQADASSAVLVVSEDVPQAVAIVMTMRPNGIDMVPKWLGRAKAATGRANRARSAPLPVHEPSDAGPPDGDGRGWQIVRGQA